MYPYHSLNPSRQLMAKDYRQLWEAVTSASDEGKAVQTLAEIVLDKDGKTFILKLEPNDAKLCIEILDRVSRDSYLLPAFVVSGGYFRALRGRNSEPERNLLFSSC